MDIRTNPQFDSYVNQVDILIRYPGFATLDLSWAGEDFAPQFTRVYFIEKGEAILTTADKTMTMKKGFAYILPAGLSFKYECIKPIEKLFFHVNLLNPDGEDLMTYLGEIIEIPLSMQSIREMISWYFSDKIADTIALKSSLTNIISEALAKYGQEMTIVCYSPLILEALTYIRRNLSAQLSLEKLAGKLFVSKNKLSKQFREEVGSPIGRYIDAQIFFNAKVLLEQRNLSIAQISNNLGFCDQFYFSRRFKQFCGESPMQYRIRYYALTQPNKHSRSE